MPSLVKPMDVDADVRGTALRLTLMLVDIGYDVASVSTPRPRCDALKFSLYKGRSGWHWDSGEADGTFASVLTLRGASSRTLRVCHEGDAH